MRPTVKALRVADEIYAMLRGPFKVIDFPSVFVKCGVTLLAQTYRTLVRRSCCRIRRG